MVSIPQEQLQLLERTLRDARRAARAGNLSAAHAYLRAGLGLVEQMILPGEVRQALVERWGRAIAELTEEFGPDPWPEREGQDGRRRVG